MTKSPGHTLNLEVWLCFWFLVSASIAAAENKPSNAQQIYQQNCASCHDAPSIPRIPKLSSLRRMSAESVLQSLEHGTMKPQSEKLAPAQKRAVAEYVSGRNFHARASSHAAGKCSSTEANEAVSDLGWNGWGANLTNTRFQ